MLLAVLLMTGGYAIKSNAQYQDIPAQIDKMVVSNSAGAGGITVKSHRVLFTNAGAMHDFYEKRAGQTLWLSGSGDTGRIEDALALFDDAWTHGLNPLTYHVKEIRTLLNDPSGADLAKLELLVTDAAMRYGHDMTGMRIDPKDIRQKAEYWRQPLDDNTIMARVSAAYNPVKGLAGLTPDTQLYNKLRRELIRLTEEDNDYDKVLPMHFGGDNFFKPGSRNKDVKSLRIRLGVKHRAEQGPENYYDDDLASAVMKFQHEHGLEPDGIVGPQTLAVLNRSNKDRKEQIVANMERLRWLEQDRPDRYILVNIPQQLLWAVDHGRVEQEMKVVVGLPYHRTKEFKTMVQGVRFNPTWTVPLSIKMNEFRPKLQKDPDYLTEKGIEIIKGYGTAAETLDPHSIDWDNISWKEMGKLRFVQVPGAHNALGQVRILMPNEYNIYMHDTNSPQYFERGQRTYSHGCIRLSEPEKLASFVLEDNKDWDDDEMDQIFADGKLTEVNVDKPFPVYIIYQTIWLDDRGDLVYGPDVYKRDQKLLEVLAKNDGYYLPQAGDTRFAALEDSREPALAYNQ